MGKRLRIQKQVMTRQARVGTYESKKLKIQQVRREVTQRKPGCTCLLSTETSNFCHMDLGNF